MRKIAFFAAAVLFVALPASALSVDELHAQIQQLVDQIGRLKSQLSEVQGAKPQADTSASDITVTAHPRLCKIPILRPLAVGETSEDVKSLQEFLKAEGVLNAEATGYFGPMTRAALGLWQIENGVVAKQDANLGWGSYGPRTRSLIGEWCIKPKPNKIFRARPTTGSAPLTVTFTANVGIVANTCSGSGPCALIADAGDHKIVFGDGTEHKLLCDGGATISCAGPHTVTHTYTTNGTYTAQLVHYGYYGPPGDSGQRVIAKELISVGADPVYCTSEYKPVCGSKQVTCITAPCNPVEQTYSNLCTMGRDGAKFVHEGQCRTSTADPEKDAQCKSWYDGCNTCSRQEPGGIAACTLRACVGGAMVRPYCTAYFSDPSNKPPVVSGISGPTSLTLNEVGTWTIQASDPENGPLSYAVTWGDEWYALPGMRLSTADFSIVQSTTFTHSYERAGTYKINVTVKDAAGKQAQISTTVTVERGLVACTKEYMPVCGRPPGCANTCPPGQYCTLICQLHEPVTYSNSCTMKAAEATLIHAGACTSTSGAMY